MPHQLEIFPNVYPIVNQFRGLLLDAYGVFWGGNDMGFLPGSKETMEALVAGGKTIGILSNTTQLSSKEIHKYHQHGLIQGRHFHFLITSGDVGRFIFLNEKLPFKTPRNTFLLFGGVHPKFSTHEAIFQDTIYKETTLIEEADFIYISVPHINGEDQENPDLFLKEIEKLRQKNLPMICPNPDQFAHEGKPPRAVVRQGSIALLYEKMGGKVFYIGKPDHKAYNVTMDCFKNYNIEDPKEVLMVGDTPETDIRGAHNFGMPSSLVTKTGIMADRIRYTGLEGAIKALRASDYPDYFIERL